MNSGKVRARIFVSGRVQGVFFRGSAQGMAQRFRVVGWVRNLPDGRVEIVCEGETANVEEFIEWCRHGPPSAEVRDVSIEYQDVIGEFDDLYVR